MPMLVDDVLLYTEDELYTRVKQDELLIDTITIDQAFYGNPSDIYLIGESYIDIKDYAKAMSWFLIGARKQHPKCIFMMGYLHEHGLCGKKNLEKATDWYIKSVETNYVQAALQLDILCKQGHYSGIIIKMFQEIENKIYKDKQEMTRFHHTYQSRVEENRRLIDELEEKISYGAVKGIDKEELLSYLGKQEQIKKELEQLIDKKQQIRQEETQIKMIENLVKELKYCAFP